MTSDLRPLDPRTLPGLPGIPVHLSEIGQHDLTRAQPMYKLKPPDILRVSLETCHGFFTHCRLETSDIFQVLLALFTLIHFKYSWSSSNAIQKAFYKACIVMDLPSEPSTSEHNQQNQDPFTIAGSSHNIDGPANPLPINQKDPFAVAGSSCNIDGPALTPGSVVANIHAQLLNGPQHPIAVGRRAVENLFAQAAIIPAPPPLNHRWVQGGYVAPPLPELPLHIGGRAVTALQVQAAALPLQQAPSQNPQIIPAPPILPLDHVPIPPIVPVPMDEDALPYAISIPINFGT
ncbi:hypothetical protein BU17DRAFT_94512 [Hysterangium stoloniferum]|nr:hypothetical protein BU17DRAFT_94512 [Hysterangium stoloniferum]